MCIWNKCYAANGSMGAQMLICQAVNLVVLSWLCKVSRVVIFRIQFQYAEEQKSVIIQYLMLTLFVT